MSVGLFEGGVLNEIEDLVFLIKMITIEVPPELFRLRQAF